MLVSNYMGAIFFWIENLKINSEEIIYSEY